MVGQTDNTQKQYMLMEITLPKGKNGMKEFSRAMVAEGKKFLGVGCGVDAVLVKRVDGEPLFQQQKEALVEGGLKENEQYVKLQMKDNLSNLIIKGQGYTRFQDLDVAVQSMGGLQGMFDDEGNARYSIRVSKNPLNQEEDVDYRYYLKKAIMSTKPHEDSDKQVVVMGEGDNVCPMYLYTLEWSPYRGTPNLEDLCGTDEAGKQELIKELKAYFCNYAGWGIPSLWLCSDSHNTWYDEAYVRLGVSENTLFVLAPHFDEYTQTSEKVLQIKQEWAQANRRPSTKTINYKGVEIK